MKPNDPFTLRDKSLIVFGAAGPLGRAISIGLAEAGANVAAASLSPSEARTVAETADAVRAAGSDALALTVDIASRVSIRAALAQARERFGRVDGAVVYPRYPLFKPFLDVTDGEWVRALGTALSGAFLAAQECGRAMIEQGQGRLIFVSSLLGERGLPNSGVFGAVQGALLGLTRSLAVEWGRTGVTVNAIALGWVDGEAPFEGDARNSLERFLPTKRLLWPSEVAGAVVYLASDAASFVMGEVIKVDGGLQNHA